jgi:hypothetical protein
VGESISPFKWHRKVGSPTTYCSDHARHTHAQGCCAASGASKISPICAAQAHSSVYIFAPVKSANAAAEAPCRSNDKVEGSCAGALCLYNVGGVEVLRSMDRRGSIILKAHPAVVHCGHVLALIISDVAEHIVQVPEQGAMGQLRQLWVHRPPQFYTLSRQTAGLCYGHCKLVSVEPGGRNDVTGSESSLAPAWRAPRLDALAGLKLVEPAVICQAACIVCLSCVSHESVTATFRQHSSYLGAGA